MITIRIYHMRLAQRVSLRQLAAMSGVGRSTINDLENGSISPRLDQLEAIARALDCRIIDLFDSDIK